jgi:hypothetical protein
MPAAPTTRNDIGVRGMPMMSMNTDAGPVAGLNKNTKLNFRRGRREAVFLFPAQHHACTCWEAQDALFGPVE